MAISHKKGQKCPNFNKSSINWHTDDARKVVFELNDKYDIKFHFVSTVDDDGWPSHWQHLIYADEEGREVLLKVGTNTLFDNYCSSLYDPEIQKVLSDLFDINGRLFISTASSLFGKNGRYNNYSEYYNSCSFINVFIIVCDQESYEEVRKKMTSIDINKKCFVCLNMFHIAFIKTLTVINKQNKYRHIR